MYPASSEWTAVAAHGRTNKGLDDRLRIAGIVLVRFDEWFDELRWNNAHAMAHLGEFPSEPLRPWTCLHADQRLAHLAEERQQGMAGQLQPLHGLPHRVTSDDIKTVLAEIHSIDNCPNGTQGNRI